MRTRAALGAVGAALVAAVLAGCAQQVNGTGTASGPTGFPSEPRSSSVPSASPSVPSPPSGSAPSAPSSSPPAPGSVAADALVARLMPRPAGSVGWTSAWARNVSPTVQQFVATEYAASSRAGVIARLQAQGLTTIAHRAWYAKDSDQADVVLLRFADQTGALSRWLSATEAESVATGSPGFTVASVPHARGFVLPHLDQLGNRRAVVYAPVHNVVIELFYYSPAQYRPADAQLWLRTQYERLR